MFPDNLIGFWMVWRTGCREDCRHFTCQGNTRPRMPFGDAKPFKSKPSKNLSLAVSISVCLCAFWNFALENTDGNDKTIQFAIKKKFWRSLEVVFDLWKSTNLETGTHMQISCDIANKEFAWGLCTLTASSQFYHKAKHHGWWQQNQ